MEMPSTHAIVEALAGLTLIAAVGTSAPARGAEDPRLRADLVELSHRSVFFGHQSVGRNLLDGVKVLAERSGVPVRIVETASIAGVPPGTFAHGAMPENGNPLLKLQSFEKALAASAADGVDIALVKFCYVDIEAGTDVPALFAAYQSTLASLKARYPRTTFVHVTSPLTTVQGGIKAFVKRLLGRPPAGVAENARREEFNALLRQATRGKEPLFDLALAESTRPDGRPETFEWNGRPVPALVPAYTSDGGHLDGEGRLRAARLLISVLASAPSGGALPKP
jgi:hypothetical protein